MTTAENRRPSLDFVALATPGGPWSVEILAESRSTNAAAAERARAGAHEGLVVITEHQTAGRGRLDRGWTTPARSSLTFSAVLRPPARVPVSRWPWLPLVAGIAVTRTLREQGYDAGVKWPNDVLLRTADGERKVCGILVERVETERGAAAIVGIGLNTSLTPEELPVPAATSLAIEAGRAGRAQPDRTALLLAVLGELAVAYEEWQEGTQALAAAYSSLSFTLGRQVRAELPADRVLRGVAVAVDGTGRLVVRTADGDTAVGAGDVVHLRPEA